MLPHEIIQISYSAGLTLSNPGLAKLLVGLIFPVGLFCVSIAGAELWTGNAAVTTVALMEKKITLQQWAKNLSCSFLGNVVGSFLMVAAVYASGMMTGNSAPIEMATKKTSLSFGTVRICCLQYAKWMNKVRI